MVRDVTGDSNIRSQMDIGEELRFLSRNSANRRTYTMSFLEHIHHHYEKENKVTESVNAKNEFEKLLDQQRKNKKL